MEQIEFSTNLQSVMSAIRVRDWHRAEQMIQSIEALPQQEDDAALAWGLFHAFRRDPQRAVTAYGAVNKQSKLRPLAMLLSGRCLMLLGQYERACQDLTFAARHLKNQFRAQYLMGLASFHCQEFRNASLYLRAALEIRPNSSATAAFLAECYYEMRAWRYAINHYITAGSFIHHDPAKWLHYAITLLRLRRTDQARREVIALRENGLEGNEFRMLEAEVAFRSRQFDDAFALLTELAPALPNEPAIPAMLGMIEAARDNYDSMARYFDQALNLGLSEANSGFSVPEILQIHTSLGRWHLEAGNYLPAADYFQKALAHPASDQATQFLLAEALWRANNSNPEAFKAVRRGFRIAAAKAAPLHYRILAAGHIEDSSPSLAIQTLLDGARMFPTDADIQLSLCEAYLLTGDITAAEQAYKNARLLDPMLIDVNGIETRLTAALGRSISLDDIIGQRAKPPLPAIFMLPETLPSSAAKAPLLTALVINLRSIHALMKREMMTRFSRTDLGYIWAVLQPLALFAVLYTTFSLMNRRVPPGLTLETFLLAGLIPFFMFVQIRGKVSGVIRGNRPLFYFRQVTPFVSYWSRTLLDFLTYVSTFYLLLFLFMNYTTPIIMGSHLTIVFGMTLLALFGMAVGIIFGALNLKFPFFEAVGTAINRGLFFTSGVFFYANELPSRLRDLLLLNPLFHVLELIRGGMFASYHPKYVNLEYVFFWLAGLMLTALVADRLARRIPIT